MEDTLAIAIYNLCGLNPYIDVLYWESWNYFFPSSSVLKTEFSLVGGIGLGLFIPVQTETGSLHSMLGLEVPMQEMQSPLGSEHSWGAQGWVGVSLVVSVLPAPSQAQGGPDPALAPASASI